MPAVGYKQCFEYFNQIPKITDRVIDITPVHETRYDPSLPKTDNVIEFMKRPVRYEVSMTVKKPNAHTGYYVKCVFDKKQSAEKAYGKFVKEVEKNRFNAMVKANRLPKSDAELTKEAMDILNEKRN